MVVGVINAIIRRDGLLKTAEGIINDLSFFIVKPDRSDGNVIYSGEDVAIDDFSCYLKIFGTDPASLFSR